VGEVRGKENEPDSKCWKKLAKCAVTLYEQDSHRDVSEAKSPGFGKHGERGTEWQSHHILCICAMGDRTDGTDSKLTQELDDALYGTDWNINEKLNMIGLPQKKKYREAYIKIEKMKPALQAAEWAKAGTDQKVLPADLPAHNIDHNLYTDEAITYLQDNVWSKFKTGGKTHETRAEWLKTQLENASKEFEKRLLNRGARRKNGTVAAWQKRFKKPKDKFWANPFSMAAVPTERYEGRGIGALEEIFKKLT